MLSANTTCTHIAAAAPFVSFNFVKARARVIRKILVNIDAAQIAHLKRKCAPCGDQRLQLRRYVSRRAPQLGTATRGRSVAARKRVVPRRAVSSTRSDGLGRFVVV